MVHLKVIDLIGTDLAVSTENGERVYGEIAKNLEMKESVNLDFEGISLIITAFLNAAIGSLFKDQKYTGDFLNKHLYLTNVDSNDVSLFTDVITRAKEYFSNKDFFEKNNNESIYGKD